MSTSANQLHLLIPGLLGPMHNLDAAAVELSAPHLEKLLSRADRSSSPGGQDYLTTLFSLFDVAWSAGRDLPEAAVNYFAGGGDATHGCWLRADPVHLHPDRDRLLLFNSEQLQINAAEAEQIAGLFNEHFAAEDFRLLTADPEHWYLRLKQCIELKTHALSQVVGHHIEPFMPEGRDAGRWRQLMNEMQMLLFQMPVNQRREAEGRLSINGIWLSGMGRLPLVKQSRFGKVYSDDPTAVGLARLANLQVESISVDRPLPWEAGDKTLMVLTDLVAPVLNADPYRWSEVIGVLDKSIASLTKQLQRIKKAEMMLYPCNGECYRVTVARLRRFWHRTKRLSVRLNEIN